MLHKNQPLCFECTECGACCHGDHDSYIETNKVELDAIREYLGLSFANFFRTYTLRYTDGTYGIRIKDNGRCSFLDQQNQCKIYPVRPTQCKTYPFWPEVLKNKHSWRSEARRCEGINRGEPLKLEQIEEKLQMCLSIDESH